MNVLWIWPPVAGQVNVPAVEELRSADVDEFPKSSHAPPTLIITLPALCAIALPLIAPVINARHSISLIVSSDL